MRRIDALRTLALNSALILTLGGTCGTSEEDTSDTGEPPDATKVFPLVKVTHPPVAPGPSAKPYPGVDWDALGPVDTQKQPAGETFE